MTALIDPGFRLGTDAIGEAGCPACGVRGQTADGVTIEANVAPARLEGIAVGAGFRVCGSRQCDVVYYRGSDAISRADVSALPFHKSDGPNRTVCFCFRYAEADIRTDVREHGVSTIAASIRERCKRGEQACASKNPAGRCCLGTVASVADAVDEGGVVRGLDEACAPPTSAVHGEGSEGSHGCCPVSEAARLDPPVIPAEEGSSSTMARASSLAVVAAALLSSACCWLPLAAAGLGLSTVGVGSLFDAWRGPLVGLSVVLFIVTGVLLYRRPRCAPGEACATPSKRRSRFNRVMFWVTSLVAIVFICIPYLLQWAGTPAEAAPLSAPTGRQAVTYRIDGMTCAGCESLARDAILALPGVESASVSYASRSAQVVWESTSHDEAIVGALSELGYSLAGQTIDEARGAAVPSP